jgi:trigger factor
VTLNIQSVEDEQRQLKVTVDVNEERVQRAMQKMARRLARDLHIPGFRPGKAPYDVVVRRVGEDALRAEAIEEMTSEIFSEMLTELDVDPYGQPTLDELELRPLQLQFTVPLKPIVDLGDYRSIRMEQEPVEVTEEAVNNALEYVRRRHEVVEPVERPSQRGDVLTVSRRGVYLDETGEEQILFDDSRQEIILDDEVTFKGTTFVDQVVGLEVGDDAAFAVTFPEDYDDPLVAGLEVKFELTVLDVKKREVPELDDELAKLEGNYDTLDELRASLRSDLEEQAKEQARADLFDGMIDKIRESATLAYPPALIEADVEDRLDDLKGRVTKLDWQWEDYLRLQNQTEEDLKETWRENAVKRVETNLVLAQLLENEQIKLTPEMVEASIEERTSLITEVKLQEELREYYKSGSGLDRLRNVLLMDLIIDRLEMIADGSAPDPASLEMTEDAEAADAGVISDSTLDEAEEQIGDGQLTESGLETPSADRSDNAPAAETAPEEATMAVSESDAG